MFTMSIFVLWHFSQNDT